MRKAKVRGTYEYGRKAQKGANLLTLMTEKWNKSQGIQVTLRGWKGQGNRFSPMHPKGAQS